MVSKHASDADGRNVVSEASDILGEDIAALFDPDRASLFATNREIQVGVFLSNEICRRRLARRGIEAVASLGLSLGEYNHLVEIEAISFSDALCLVEARGRVYDAGPEGMMVSLYPTSRGVVEDIIERVRGVGVVSISNENSPKQFVIAGERPAVERAAAIFEDEEYAAPVTIEDRIPMHSAVFKPASVALHPYLKGASWQTPAKPYLPNATAISIPAATSDQIINSLTEHVYKPVLWRKSIDAILGTYPNATFVEVGPRKVLCNLLSRKWIKSPRFSVDEMELDGFWCATSTDRSDST